jgi:hypothetical protein
MRRHGGSDLTLGFAGFRILEIAKVSHISERYFQQNLLKRGRSIFTRIERHVSVVITRSVSPGSTVVETETFKGRELKIVLALEEVKARIFQDKEFPLFENVLNKRIRGGNCGE